MLGCLLIRTMCGAQTWHQGETHLRPAMNSPDPALVTRSTSYRSGTQARKPLVFTRCEICMSSQSAKANANKERARPHTAGECQLETTYQAKQHSDGQCCARVHCLQSQTFELGYKAEPRQPKLHCRVAEAAPVRSRESEREKDIERLEKEIDFRMQEAASVKGRSIPPVCCLLCMCHFESFVRFVISAHVSLFNCDLVSYSALDLDLWPCGRFCNLPLRR